MRGLRRDLLQGDCLPPVISDLPYVPLIDLLDPSLQPQLVRARQNKAQENLSKYEEKIRVDVQAGIAGRVAVVETHRAFGKVYVPQIHYDCCPPLQAAGVELFLMSTDDISRPRHERKLFRPMCVAERFRMQGQKAEYSLLLKKSLAAHAAGNAFTVSMIGRVVIPLLNQIALSGIMQGQHPMSQEKFQQLISKSVQCEAKVNFFMNDLELSEDP